MTSPADQDPASGSTHVTDFTRDISDWDQEIPYGDGCSRLALWVMLVVILLLFGASIIAAGDMITVTEFGQEGSYFGSPLHGG